MAPDEQPSPRLSPSQRQHLTSPLLCSTISYAHRINQFPGKPKSSLWPIFDLWRVLLALTLLSYNQKLTDIRLAGIRSDSATKMFAWLNRLFAKSEPTKPAEEPKHRGKSHSRSHSKRVRERERDLRREWTGQKGGWKKFYSRGGFGGVCGGWSSYIPYLPWLDISHSFAIYRLLFVYFAIFDYLWGEGHLIE